MLHQKAGNVAEAAHHYDLFSTLSAEAAAGGQAQPDYRGMADVRLAMAEIIQQNNSAKARTLSQDAAKARALARAEPGDISLLLLNGAVHEREPLFYRALYILGRKSEAVHSLRRFLSLSPQLTTRQSEFGLRHFVRSG